jgi:hypothetical protein
MVIGLQPVEKRDSPFKKSDDLCDKLILPRGTVPIFQQQVKHPPTAVSALFARVHPQLAAGPDWGWPGRVRSTGRVPKAQEAAPSTSQSD